LAAGHDPDRRRPWLLTASGTDAVDVAGPLWSLPRLRPDWGSVATVVLGSLTSIVQLRAAYDQP